METEQIDTIKTRIQRATALKGETAWTRFTTVAVQMFKAEGPQAFYKGITPRVMRVAPGQAVRFVFPFPFSVTLLTDNVVDMNRLSLPCMRR